MCEPKFLVSLGSIFSLSLSFLSCFLACFLSFLSFFFFLSSFLVFHFLGHLAIKQHLIIHNRER